jgi:hypothetical protein
MDEYVEVYTASDITSAYLMKAILENAGIPVQITNENLQGVYCLDGMVPSVLVAATHVERAKQIIKEIQQSSEDGATKEFTSAYSDTANKRMQKRRKKILKITLLALLVLYLVTWGIHIELFYYTESDNPLGNSLDNRYHVPNPPYMTAYLDGGDEVSCRIPSLLTVVTEKPPYCLNLVFFVNSSEIPDGVIVSHLEIKHDNGKAYTLVQPDNPKRNDAFHSHPDYRGVLKTNAIIRLPNSIRYSSSFTIETKGHLYKGEDTIPFEQTIELRYIPQRLIVPGWWAWLLSRAFD